MKIKLFAMLILVLVLTLPATKAETDILRDMVDIGDVSSEAGHNLLSWGPIEPDTHGGDWGGIATDPESPDKKCRLTYDKGGGDTDPAAYVTLWPTGKGSIQYIKVRVMDGIADDSFKVYVRHPRTGMWIEVYFYSSDVVNTVEYWIVHTISLSDSGVSLVPQGIKAYKNGFAVKIEATAVPTTWPALLAVDWIKVYGNGKP